MKRWVFFLVTLLPMAFCASQTLGTTMVNGDTIFISACEYEGGIIYDNGGPTGSYSNNFDGWVVITAPTGVTVTLSGNYETENCCDKITVWDGYTSSTPIVNEVRGTGTIVTHATSGRMTIYFHTDHSVTQSGFALQWSRGGYSSTCTSGITSLEASDITANTATLSWTSASTTLKLDYGNGVLTVDGNSPAGGYALTGLNSNTLYSVRLYAESEVANPCCIKRTSFRTQCGSSMAAPIVESFDDYGYGPEVFPTCWTLVKNIDGTLPANVSHDNYSSWPASLRMSTTVAGYYAIAIMPEVTGTPINQLTMRLKVWSAYSGAKLEVGVCSGTEQYNHGFTAMDTVEITSTNRWVEFVVPMSGYSGTGMHPALRMHGNLQTSSNMEVYIDELSVQTCGVWNKALLKRNAHEMWVQWDEYGDPRVDVEYGPAGFVDGDGITISDTASPLHVMGLDPSTRYEFRFHTGCNGGAVGSDYSSLTLSTLEGPNNDLNLCEGFETSGTLPDGWRRVATYDNTPQTNTYYHHSGNHSLRLRPYYTTTMPIVVLPMIDTVEISRLSVSFWAYPYYTTTGRVIVGVMEYPEVTSSFVPVDTVYIDVNRVWQRKQVSLGGYTGNGKYIALRAFDPSTYDNDMYIDDLEVGTCLLNGAYVTNIGSHSMEVRWDTVDASYHGDSVKLEWRVENGEWRTESYAVRGAEVQTVGRWQTVAFSGLEADSSYEFRVYGQCDTMVQACATTTLTAHTLAQDFALPYCVDFEGMPDGSYPSGWLRPSMYDNYPRIYDNGSDKHSGNRAIALRSYYDNHSTMVLPMFDVDSVSGLTLSFYAWSECSSGATMQIGVMDDPNDESTFTLVATANIPYNQWSSHVYSLESYSGTGRYIAFRHTNNYNYYSSLLWIDDLVVGDAAAWYPRVTSVTSHGATFLWNGTGQAYNGAYVEWDTAGFVRGTGHKDTVDANTFSFTVDTLQPGTNYDYFITAISNEADVSCDYTRQSFTTFAQPTAASYCYGFEDMNDYGFPVGWTKPETNSNTPRVSTGAGHSGSKGLLFYSTNCYTPYHACAVMPYLEEEDLTGITLSFWANGSGSQTHLTIGMTNDPNCIDDFDTLAVFPVNHWGTWNQYSIDLGSYIGNARHIVFRWATLNGCNSGDLYIDDITINRCRVSGVRAYSETTTSVKIGWDSTGVFDSVEIEYGPQGFTPGSGTFVYTTDTVVTLSGLTEGTAYDYYVRPYCTGSTQVCSEAEYQFSTTPWRVGDGWCCDFEENDNDQYTYGTPSHWSRAVAYGSRPATYRHTDSRYYTSHHHAFEFYAPSGSLNIAVLPASEDPLSGLVLSFNMRLHPEHRNPERCTLIVGVMPDPYDTASFVAIDTVHPTYAWQRHDVSLASYTGPYRHIALKYLNSDGRITYIDDLTLSHCRPTNARVTAVADSSISLSWQRMGYSDTTYIKWRVENGEWGTLRVAGTDTTIGGLLPDTNYTFLLFGGCADTSLECQGVRIHQRTLAEPLRIPSCYLFDDVLPPSDQVPTTGEGLPTGWVRPYGNTESGQHNGTLRLYAYNCNNTEDRTSMVAMPRLEASTLSNVYLDFTAKFENTDLRLEVGVMTDPYDTSTFLPLDTLSGSTQWGRKTVDLGSHTLTHPYIAFRSYAHYCSSGYIYIDRLSLRPCIITAAHAGMPTETTLTLSYSGSTGAWVEYHTVGSVTDDFNPGSGTMLHLTSSPYLLEGLHRATWYAFHFYPDCGPVPGQGGNGVNDHCNYVTVRAQTDHEGIDVPYCDNFDNYIAPTFPNNWRRLSTYNTDYPQLSTSVRHSDDNAMSFRASGDLHSLAVMPRLNVEGVCANQIDSLFASFWINFGSYYYNAAFVVGYVTDANDEGTFVALDTIRSTQYNTWEHHLVTIRHLRPATMNVAYKLISTDGYYTEAYLDDLCMEMCVASNVTVSEVTQNSVTISWDSHGVDSLVCEYGPQGFTAGTGTVVVLHDNPAVITGLDNGTEYQFSFGSICGCESYGGAFPAGGGWSGWGWSWGHCWGWRWHYAQNPTDSTYRYWCWGGWHGHSWSWPWGGHVSPFVDTVVTQAAYLEVPYCESFDDYSRISTEDPDLVEWPRSWRRIGGQTPGYPKLTRTNHHSGDNSLVFYAPVTSSNYAALAPLESGRVDDLILTFFAYATNQNAVDYPRFIVGVMSDPDNASTFVPVDTVRLSATNQWEQHAVDLSSYSGTGQYVAFCFKPVNAQYHYYIDDLYLGTCAVSQVTLAATQTDVTLHWQTLHTVAGVNVEYGPQGSSAGSGSSLTLYSSPATLTGLDPDSSYEIRVSALCDSLTSPTCTGHTLTLNPRLVIPYCENFEDLPVPDWPEASIPDTWTVVQRNSNKPQYPRVENQYSQHIMAFFPSSSTGSNTVLLPPLPSGDSLAGKWVYAYFATSNNSGIYLDYGYLADTNNPFSFVTMATMNNGANDQLNEYNVRMTLQTPPADGDNYNRFALRARSTSGERWVRLSRLVVANHPYPTGIASTPLGVARRRITWNNLYGNSHYDIEYGFGSHWQTVASDSCSATLTGLQSGQRYEVYFVSPQGERFCLPYEFLNEEYTPLPYCENFDSYGNAEAIPRWYSYSTYNENPSYPRTYSSAYNSCCRSLDFYCNNSNTQYIALPDFDIDSVRHLSLRFNLRISYANYTKLVVGVIENRNDLSSFTSIDTITCPQSDTYYPQHINLSSYTGIGRYVVFRILTTYSGRTSLFIDDLEISDCPLPDITLAGAHQAKAQLPYDGTPDYYIEYDTAGFQQGTGRWTVHVTGNPYYITGLDTNTTYSFYARCDSATLTCAAPTTLTTAQEINLPYCENFDSYGNAESVSGWYSYSTYNDNPQYPRTHNSCYNSCCRTLDFYCNRDNLQYIAMPDVTVGNISQIELYFNLRIELVDYTRLIVGVMDNPHDPNTFTPVDTLTCTSNSTYQAKHVSLSNYAGTGRFVAFRIHTTYSWRTSLFIDDLRISAYPAPQITLAHANTVRIVRGDSRDFWIEMAPQDTLQGSDTNRWFHITQDTIDITGLDYLTTYDFYLHTDSGDVTCFPRTQITTSIVQSMPYCDDFSSYPNWEMPTGWTVNNPYRSDYPCKNSNGHIQFYNNCTSGSRSYAIMPEMDIDSLRHANLYLNVWSESNNLFFLVGVMSDKNDVSTFTIVDTLRPSGTGFWQPMQVSFSSYRGNGRFIAFCFVNPNGNCSSMYIDDLFIQACPRPAIQLVGGTTVRVIQPDSTRATDYWLEYGPQNMTPGATDTAYNADSSAYTLSPHNTLLHVTTDTLLLTDLDENTIYDFYARCDSATSSCYPRTARITTSATLDIPTCFDFSTLSTYSMPQYWRRYSNDYYSDYPYIYDHYIYFYRSNNNTICQAVLPDFGIDSVKNLHLTFSITTDYVGDGIIVGVMSNPDDISTFTPVDTLRSTANNNWETVNPRLDRYTGDGRFIALRQITTGTYHRVGAWGFRIENCDIPAATSAILHSHNQVRIEAPEQSHTGFWVEYDTTGFVQGSGQFLHVDTLPAIITLDNSTTYDFYFRCDTLVATCAAPQTVTTLPAPSEVPYCENFDSYSTNVLPTNWHTLNMNNDATIATASNEHHSGTRCLRMTSYSQRTTYAVLPDFQTDSVRGLTMSLWVKGDSRAKVTVGVMSNPNDPASFMAIKQISGPADWTRYLVSFSSAPSDGRFIALRYTSTYYYYPDIYIDDLYLAPCGATEMHVVEVEADHVTFDWNQTGSPAITIEYGPTGFLRGNGNIVTVTTPPPYILTGLNNLTNYAFYFDAICDDGTTYCTTNYSDSARVFTPLGGTGCIDPTNLTADYTTCFYGSYGNPYANEGVIDFGWADSGSRHTVHYDLTETDARTGGALHTIPEGAQASVRLGNWGSGAQGEAIAYNLAIDTTQFDLLILKYAAVLQDNDHPSTAQPRFKMELLDENGSLLDTCSAADFIANQALGWNLVPETYVLWKDWTTVGVDVSAYHGMIVTVRLTVFDCLNGDHFGYAYFTLNCMSKTLVTSQCGDVAENTFTAPSGFAYNWYSNQDPTIFSTEQTIVVPTDNTETYYCNLAFVDNPYCYFTMSAFAGTRYPLSLFDSAVVIRDCHFEVTFNNNSTISMDGVNPVGTGEGVESAAWDFGNGTGSALYNPPMVVYDSAGTYTVSLISTIAGGACADTLNKEITLVFPNATPHIEGPTDRCADAAADTLFLLEATQWRPWSRDTILVAPSADTTYNLVATDSNGCQHRLTHTLNVHPVYHDSIRGVICDGAPYSFDDTTFAISGTYVRNHTTAIYGCDSTTTLLLTVNSHSDTVIMDTVNELYLPRHFLDTAFNESVSHLTYIIPNAAGCDSTIDYSLTVIYNPKRTVLDSTICESALPLLWQGVTFAAAGSDSLSLVATHGEDSTVVMRVTVVATTDSTVYDTIVENQLPYPWNNAVFLASGSIVDTLVGATGCDSIVTMNLFVHMNVDTTLFDTVCESALPLHWNNRIFNATGTLVDTLPNRFGADSVITMNLTVHATTYSTVNEMTLENDLPHIYHNLTLYADTTGAIVSLVNAAGCDSIVTYSLTVYWNGSTVVDSTVCEDMLPVAWNHRIFTAAGTQFDTLLTVDGADSLIAMTLHVNPIYNDTIPLSICDNQTLTFEDTLYTGADAGLHPHLLQTVAGCDSLRVLSLSVNATTTGDTVANVCDSLEWYDSTYTLNTEYPTHLTVNAAGCDSTVTLHLTVRHSTDTVIHDTIVENLLPYPFNGTTFATDTTDALVTIPNAAGCDSVITYSLTVYRNVDTTLYDTLCNSGLPITWNGLSIDTSLTATATLRREVTRQNRHGADSTIVLLLTVHPLYDHHLYDTLCDNQSLVFGDSTFLGSDGSTTHLDSLHSLYGCDSLSTLHLTVYPTFDHHFSDTICSNQSVTFCGTSYNLTGDYTHTLQSLHHCDSLSTLHLQVWPAYDNHTRDTICDDSSRFFIDSAYRQTGDYPYTFLSIHACDSLETLHLKVYPTYDIHLYDTIYQGDHYTFEQAVYDTTGVYPHLLQSTFGCDSLRTLHLQRNPRTYLDSAVCQNHLPIVWNGVTFTQAGSASIHRVSSQGEDSLVVMTLQVHDTASTTLTLHACDSLRWQDGVLYTASTTSPSITLATSQGCDSVLHLALTIDSTHLATDSIEVCDSVLWIDGHWYREDTTGATHTLTTVAGCDSIVTLALTTGATLHTWLADTICYNETYSWHGLTVHSDRHPLTERFDLADTLRAADGCDSVIHMALIKLALPTFTFDTTAVCYRRQYLLSATVTAPFEPDGEPQHLPYYLWSSYPIDTLLDFHEQELSVEVEPMENGGRGTQYVLFADYSSTPRCPATDSITLYPLRIPEAKLQVNPQILEYPNLSFSAHDISHLPDAKRTWYIDGERKAVDGPTLSASAPNDVDSFTVALELFNGQCHDTAIVLVPIHRIHLLAPNIFTPLEGDGNSRFFIATEGVISGELFIYNREGMLVHRTSDYTEGWDGRDLSGTMCQQGNYVWKLVYKSVDRPTRDRIEVGSVLLIK